MVTLADLQVTTLGERKFDSPLAPYVAGRETNQWFVADTDRILFDDTIDLLNSRGDVSLDEVPSFEPGGPREKLFFDAAKTRAGIVTCGGLCPGLNDVIRALVLELVHHYGVTEILGFRHGYAGLVPGVGPEPYELTPDFVDTITDRGGTILGTSRGPQDVPTMVDTLVDRDVDILFVIGGDGSMRGAHEIAEEVGRRGLAKAIVGIPKTIDNDIPLIGTSFGFQTAFTRAAESVNAARVEASAVAGGVGIVKLMGRSAGFIACYAALANHDADFVLVPEVPFVLDGPHGLLARLRQRVDEDGSAVIVLAEGAGQDLVPETGRTDASGNKILGDFASHLRERITADFAEHDRPLAIRYFDPGYQIRSGTADAFDSVYCTRLAQAATHAAMAGCTDMVVGRPRHRFVHVPIGAVVASTHQINPTGDLWLSVLESTRYPIDEHQR